MDRQKKCLECGKIYDPRTVTQKYCSAACGMKYRAKGKHKYPSLTFYCANCGKKVITEEDTRDRRTRFCSGKCERKYWKHPHTKEKTMNVPKSGT